MQRTSFDRSPRSRPRDRPGPSAPRARLRVLAGAALTCGLVLTGCGPAEQPAPPPPAPDAPPPVEDDAPDGDEVSDDEDPGIEEPEDASHTGTDQEFARRLLAHHQLLLEISSLARESGDPRAARFAERTAPERQAEADELTAWLTAVEGAPSGSAPEDLVTEDDEQSGLPHPDLVEQLRTAHGDEFTAPFKQAVSELYGCSEQLAQAEMQEGSAAQMRALAERILDEHDGERAELAAL